MSTARTSQRRESCCTVPDGRTPAADPPVYRRHGSGHRCRSSNTHGGQESAAWGAFQRREDTVPSTHKLQKKKLQRKKEIERERAMEGAPVNSEIWQTYQLHVCTLV